MIRRTINATRPSAVTATVPSLALAMNRRCDSRSVRSVSTVLPPLAMLDSVERSPDLSPLVAHFFSLMLTRQLRGPVPEHNGIDQIEVFAT